MKKTIKLMTLLLLLFFVAACSDDDDASTSEIEFSPELLNGTWKISFFSDENQVRTSEFSSYQFTFDVNEEDVIITSNGNTESGGTYVFEDDVNGTNFWIIELDFNSSSNPGSADLQDLDEDWIVRKLTQNPLTIELEERFSNSAPEFLHIEKVSN